jgi:tyrosine-protein phosphatase SIW14
MSDTRIKSPATQVAATPPPVRPDAARSIAPAIAGDRLTLSAKPVTPSRFSWRRAIGHFERGLVKEFKQMVLAPIHHPWATLLTIGASAAIILAAPIIGISAAAVGNVMLIGFAGLAIWQIARATTVAFKDYQKHDFTRAEGDFEAIGASSADLAATVGPVVVGKGFTILRRTEAGQALIKVVAGSKIGQSVGAAKTGAFSYVRSLGGRFVMAPGQSKKVAALRASAHQMTTTLTATERRQVTLGRLNEWRLNVAKSRAVRGFNQVFDTIPSQWSDQIEGKALTSINYNPSARSVRDWALLRVAKQRGHSLAEVKAVVASRRVIPNLIGHAKTVSPVLSRGPVPTTAADFEFLQKQRIKTIVTLLHPDNPEETGLLAAERALAAKYGIKVVDLPLPFGIDPPAEMVDRFLAVTDKATAGSRVYVHCRLGRDRTGTMVAVYREARQGVSGEQALAEMRTFGFNPEKDTYLAYLAKFVLGYANRGVVDAQKVLLNGDIHSVSRAVRGQMGAELAANSSEQRKK